MSFYNETTAEETAALADGPSFVVRAVHVYKGYLHLPLVASICCFGTVANLVNIIVLMRKAMRQQPVNVMLIGLSGAQLLLNLNYLIYTIYAKWDNHCNFKSKTFWWLALLLVNVNLNLVLHTIALVHTSLLAVFRWLVIHFPHRPLLVTRKRAVVSVWLAFLVTPMLCTSFYLNSEIKQYNALKMCLTFSRFNTSTIQRILGQEKVTTYRLKYNQSSKMLAFNFWIFGVFFKLLPCLWLGVLSWLLIRDMRVVHKRRQTLLGKRTGARRQQQQQSAAVEELKDMNQSPSMLSANGGGNLEMRSRTSTLNSRTSSPASSLRQAVSWFRTKSTSTSSGSVVRVNNSREKNKVTRMLAVIVSLFIVVEFPQAVLNIIVAGHKVGYISLSKAFFTDIYSPLGDVYEVLTLVYSSVNFILYCTMSSQFRAAFHDTFLNGKAAQQLGRLLPASFRPASLGGGGTLITARSLQATPEGSPRMMTTGTPV